MRSYLNFQFIDDAIINLDHVTQHADTKPCGSLLVVFNQLISIIIPMIYQWMKIAH